MRHLKVDRDWLRETLLQLISIPSPVGLTDAVVRYTAHKLDELEVPYELTRRGAIRATLAGRARVPARAVVAHLDTLGAMVRELKPNGRLGIVPIGSWSARFAEGGRVSVYKDEGFVRGTVLPLRASGHAFGDGVDELAIGWDHVEVRVDEPVYSAGDLDRAGIHVGDFIAFDPNPEVLDNGYICSRHLDDKAAMSWLTISDTSPCSAAEEPEPTSSVMVKRGWHSMGSSTPASFTAFTAARIDATAALSSRCRLQM